MDQSRLVSLIETITNTAVGFLFSLAVWPFAAAVTGIAYTGRQHVGVVFIFTVASVGRGYLIRRFFNNGLHVLAVKMARRVWFWTAKSK